MLSRFTHWLYILFGTGLAYAVLKNIFSFILKPWRDDLDEAWKRVARGHTDRWRERFFYLRIARRHRRNKLLRDLSTDPVYLIQFLLWPFFFSFNALYAQYQSSSPLFIISSGPGFHHLFALAMTTYPDFAYGIAICSWGYTFYALARSRDQNYLKMRLDRTDRDIQSYATKYRPELLPELKRRFHEREITANSLEPVLPPDNESLEGQP